MLACSAAAVAKTLAADRLQCAGADILARNLRCCLGELDIVAWNQNVLLTVEERRRLRRRSPGASNATSLAPHNFLMGTLECRAQAMRIDVIPRRRAGGRASNKRGAFRA